MSNGSSINVNLDIGAILRKKRERDLGQKLLGATEGILSSEEQTVLKGSTREEIYQYIQAKSVMATGQAKTQEAELYKRIQNLPQFQNMAGVSPQTPVSTEPTPEGVETKYPTPANRLSPYIKSMDVGAFNIGFPLPDEVTAQELENKVKETKALKEARGETPTKETMRLSRETLFQTVNKMENLLNTIPSAEGIGGRISGVKERLSALSGYNPQLQVYNQFKQAVLGQVTKVIGGETGSRLSDQDVKRMAGAFPSEFSTTSERKLQWQTFKQMINDIAVTYGAKSLFGQETQTQYQEGQTATNPKTGEKLIFRGGKWQKM